MKRGVALLRMLACASRAENERGIEAIIDRRKDET